MIRQIKHGYVRFRMYNEGQMSDFKFCILPRRFSSTKAVRRWLEERYHGQAIDLDIIEEAATYRMDDRDFFLNAECVSSRSPELIAAINEWYNDGRNREGE